LTTTDIRTSTYAIDPIHSTAEFSVKHMMVSTVKGRFLELEGAIHLDESEPARSWVEASINTASVDTGVEMRDNDLRSDNFFAADRFPKITFRSKRVEAIDGETWNVVGDLTIRDVTREVILKTELEGRGPDFQGVERIGFTAETSFNRSDFGLTYNAVLETGGLVVGDKVKVALNIEAIRQD
jgi:polyisoprenoid-binding protein YceI